MPELEYAGKKVQVDEDGCLVSFQDWDENLARAMAMREGIAELTQKDMVMLKFIRDYYQRYDFFPIVRSICKIVHERKDCLDERFSNPLVAWKVAGLPHPEEPIVSLLKAGQSPG
jgi:TusE/DsrC/DsvC family sulfur relay protein